MSESSPSGASAPGLPRFTDLEDEYEIVRELGRGGTAVVFLARDRELGRDVAIKVIRATYVEDEEASARLVREAKTVAGLQHPNVVMLYGTRRLSDGSIALIMQYVPGRPLKEEIRASGPLPAELTVGVLKDIARALDYAHQRRIVHRDIKPENIYLDDEAGIARLADFGIARPWDTDSGLTLPGVAIGTPAYMSPEQIDGKELDGRSDLYSLGLVGYEMLTGEAPWAGENVYSTIFRQRHEALPRLSDVRPDTPETLDLAISGCLVKDRDMRWNDATEFMDVLRGAIPEDADEILAAAWTGSEDGGMGPAGRDAGNSPDGAVAEDAPTISYRRDEEGAVVLSETEAEDAIAVQAVDSPPLRPDRTGRGSTSSGVPIRRSSDSPASRPENARRAGDRQRKRGKKGWIVFLALGFAGALAWGVWALGVVPVDFLPGGVETPGAAGPGATESDPGSTGGMGPEPGAEDGEFGTSSGPLARAPAEGEEGGAGSGVEGGSPTGVGPAGPPSALTSLSGSGQTGSAGDTLPIPVAVVVRDSAGRAVSGATVRFATVSGGGAAIPPAVATDGAGIAEARWRVGAGAGEHALVASVEGRPSLQARFEALVTPAEPAGLGVLSGRGQRSEPGSLLPDPVRVRVTDGSGNPVPNALVAFNPSSGGGGASPSTAMTDQNGVAEARWRLGDQSGTQALQAYLPESAGGTETSVTISAEALLSTLSPRAMVASGGTHSCVLDASGRAACWGDNGTGQLGEGGTQRQMEAARVVTGTRFARLTAGVSFTCGLSVDGRAYCWGANGSGQLGTGGSDPSATPVPVATDRRFGELGAGLDHACGVSRDAVMLCWGSNESGKLGTGNEIDQEEPAPVIGGFRYSDLAVGWGHTCGLTREGRAVCWGRNASGELGDGTTQARSVPTGVEGARSYRMLAAGSAHTCGVTAGGELYCWGQNTFGQLGDGSRENRRSPVPVASDVEFSSVVGGGVHTCALSTDGTAYCWGRNAYGQLGDGTDEDRTTPVPVAGDHEFATLSARGAHTCGRTTDGVMYCWGYNSDGQLGDGTRTNRSSPVRAEG